MVDDPQAIEAVDDKAERRIEEFFLRRCRWKRHRGATHEFEYLVAAWPRFGMNGKEDAFVTIDGNVADRLIVT
jgi:hypothetical protein